MKKHPSTWIYRYIYTIVILGVLLSCQMVTGQEREAEVTTVPESPSLTKTLPASATETLTAETKMVPQQAGVALRPFPQHVQYPADTIKPNHVLQDQLDEEVAEFYQTWKESYLKSGDEEGCGPDRYYVRFSPEGPVISVSEGHGYGMLLTVLMAGHDPEARKYFDGLYYFFKDHPSQKSPNLMAWRQMEGCITEADDLGTATDGDMDIAYALLLADAQWGSGDAINYRQEAIYVIQAIMQNEINPEVWSILLGDWADPTQPIYYFSTRTSDFMPNHLRAYQAASGDDRWKLALEKGYGLVSILQTTYSPNTGLLPDFIQDTNLSPRPADPGFLESPHDGRYFYNACRDPWHIGVDYLLSGDLRAKQAIEPINTWLIDHLGGNPALIRAGYALDGSDIEDNDYTSLAFVAPLGVAAMMDGSHQDWLNNIWDLVVNKEMEGYYEDTLKLLSMLVMSGNWWAPAE